MPLIYRCAAKVARESMRYQVPVDELLGAIGWMVPAGVERPEDPTVKELTEWVRNVATQNERSSGR